VVIGISREPHRMITINLYAIARILRGITSVCGIKEYEFFI
jgi:hypothetical protein